MNAKASVECASIRSVSVVRSGTASIISDPKGAAAGAWPNDKPLTLEVAMEVLVHQQKSSVVTEVVS